MTESTDRNSPGPAAAGEELERLLQDSGRGDRLAFRRFFDATAPRVQALLRRWLASSRDAEELLSEVYFKVWRASDRFDPARGTALAWIAAIAHRHALDHLRQERRRGDAEAAFAGQLAAAAGAHLAGRGGSGEDPEQGLGPRAPAGWASADGPSCAELRPGSGVASGSETTEISPGPAAPAAGWTCSSNPAAADPAELGARAELSERLHGALAGLPPEQRQAVQAVFFDGLSHAAAAQHLALPLGTIKSRIRAALQQMRLKAEIASEAQP